MRRFRYTALLTDGATANGVIEAKDQQEAADHLASRGEIPVRIAPAGSFGLIDFETAPSRAELAEFLKDLASLHEAGVPLRHALDVLSAGGTSRKAQKLARLIGERLDSGADLGSAARVGGGSDVALAAELARAGEQSGRLHETLRVGASILERQAQFSQRIRGALAYPLFLLTLSIFAVIALAAFAGPALAPILEDAEGEGGTLRHIIGFGEFLRSNGLQLAAGLGATAMIFAFFAGRAPLRDRLAALRCTLPFFRLIVRDLNCGAFARTFGALIAGGAPAARALDLASASAPNSAWRARLALSGEALREGRTVTSALLSIEGLPIELSHLARVGEQTGALGEMATRAGDLILDRALRRLDMAAAVAGPLLLVTMGAFIAWMMSAFLGGLSSLGDFAL